MANNTRKKIQYDVGFNTDTKQLDEVKKQLQEISKLTNTKFKQNGIFSTDEMQKIRSVATEVSNAINKAYNPKINSVNITKFNNELAKSNLTVKQIYDNFNKVGTTGQNAFRNLETSLLTTNKELKQTHTFLDNIATTLSNTIKWNAASAAVNSLTEKVSGAVSYVERLDSSLNDIRIVTGQSADEMDKFAVKANKAAESLGKSTLDYTKAALTYYQQGLSDDEVAARTEVTMKASNVTGQSTDDVAEQLTAVWNGFKVAAEDTEEYVDKLAAVGAATASDLEELSTGMAKVASGAASMGVNIDQLTASLATIVSTTRQDASSVGTALKTIYSRIADIEAGTDDAETSLGNYSGKMAELGFNVLDSEGKMRDLGEVMEEIGNDWQNLSREQQIYLAQTMAGTRQYNNLIALFDNWEQYQSALNVSQKAAGTLQQQQNVYLESTTAHINELNTAWDSLYNSTLDADTINTVTDGLKVLVKLTDNWIQSIGGGKGALLNLGAIATNVFSKQIASSIAISINNLKSQQQQIEETKARLAFTDEVKNNSSYDEESRVIAEMANNTTKYASIMSDAQQQYSNSLIETQTELLNEKAAYDQASASAVEYLKNHQSTQNLNLTDDDTTLNNASALEGILDDLNVQLVEEADNYATLKKSLDDAKDSYNAELKPIALTKEALEQKVLVAKDLLETYELLNKEMASNPEGFSKTNQTAFAKDTEKLENYFGKSMADISSRDVAAAFKDDNFKKIFESVSSTYSRMLSNMITEANTAAEAIANESNGAGAEIEQKITDTKIKFDEFIKTVSNPANIQGVVQLTGGVTSLAATISNVKNLWDIWTNSSLSETEKLTQTITGLTSTIASAAMTYNSLQSGLTTVLPLLGASAAAAPQVALAIMGIGAAISAGTAVWEYFAKAAENARNKVDESVKSYQEAVENLESLNDELTTNKEKLEELLAIDVSSRTKEQEDEIANLQSQNALLETKIALEKQLAHKDREDTINNYESAEAKGAYDNDSSFIVEDGDSAIADTYQLDTNDEKGWQMYQDSMESAAVKYREDGNEKAAAELDKRLEAAKTAREKALQDIVQFNNENLQTWEDTAQAYLDEEKQIPEELSQHILGAMTSAGTLKETTDNAVKAALSGGEEEFNKILSEKENKTKDNSWADILDETALTDMQGAADGLNITLDDLMNTVFSGNRGWGDFTDAIKNADDEIQKFTGVSDDTIDSLSELIEKMQSKGTDSLTDSELKSLEEVESELIKLDSKYSKLSDIRNQNEIEYIKLIREGRKELRETNAVQAAEEVTSGKSARAATSNVRNVQLQVDDKRFREDMAELLDDKYALEIEINTDLSEATQEITNAYSSLQKGFNMIDENLKVSGDEVVSFMQTFPNLTDVILENSSRCADGSIQFSKSGFEAFKTAATNEIKVDTEKTESEIQNQITKYESEISQLDTTIEALDAYIAEVESGDDVTVTSKENATNALNQLNADLYNNAVTYANEASGETVNTEADAQSDITDNYEKALENRLQLANQYYSSQNAMIQELVQAETDAANGVTHVWSNADAKDLYQNGYKAKLWSSGDSSNSQYVIRQDVSTGNYVSDEDFSSILKTRDALAAYRDYLKTGLGQLNGYLSQLDAANYSLDNFQGKGSSSSGSSTAHIADIVDKLTDELDAYHDINIQIQTLENEMDMLQAQEKNVFGNDLIQNYADQVSNVTEQFSAWQKKLEVNKQVISDTKALLSKFNLKDKDGNTLTIKYDEKGQISNYNDILKASQDKINQDTDKYNAMSYTEQQSESGKTLKQNIEQDTKTRSLLQSTMDSYNTALNETGPEAEKQLETLKTQLSELYAELADIDTYKIDLGLKDRSAITEPLNEISSALDSLSSEMENLTTISNDLLGEDFYNNISRAKTALTTQLIVAVAQTAKTFWEAKNKIEDTNTMMKNLKSAVEASKKSLQALLDQMEASGQEDTYGIGNVLSGLNEINLDSENIVDVVKAVLKINQSSGQLTDIANMATEAAAQGGEAAATAEAAAATTGEAATALAGSAGTAALGYVGIAIMIAKAAYSLAKMINSYSEKMSEIRIAESNYDIDQTLRSDEYLSKWQSFRRIMEDLKDTDYLGKLKQDLRDIVENLNGISFNGENIDSLDDFTVKASKTKSVIEQLYEKVSGLTQSINDGSYENTYGSGILWWHENNLDKALDDLDKYTDDFMDKMEEIQNLFVSARQIFVQAWSSYGDELDRQVKRYETITSSIEHNKNMMTLLYGDEAYSKLNDWYNLETQVNESRLSYQKQQVEYWEKQMMALDEDSDAWKEAESQWQSALDSFNSALESAVQNIIDKYSNSVNEIFANMTNQLTNGSGLSWLQTEMNLMNKYSDHYLDGVNSIYQVTSLQNKFMDAINNAEGNVTAQERIKKLMDEQLADLKSRDKLTKYDVERAEKLLDIETARQALKDAQNNNSKMRLTRDSQGNYSYSYVADEDATNEAKQQLADAQNSLYNFDKDQYSQNLSEMYSIYEEYVNKMTEIATNQSLEQAERERQENELTQEYQEYITGLVQDNEQIRSNLADSTFQNYFANQEIAKDITSSNYQQFMDYCEKAGLSFDETTGKMTTDVSSLSEGSKEKLENFGLSFDETTGDLKLSWKSMTDENQKKFSECMDKNVPLWNSSIQGMIGRINSDDNSFKNMSTAALNKIIDLQKEYNSLIDKLKTSLGGLDFTKPTTDLSKWKDYTDSISTKNNAILELYDKQAKELIEENKLVEEQYKEWQKVYEEKYKVAALEAEKTGSGSSTTTEHSNWDIFHLFDKTTTTTGNTSTTHHNWDIFHLFDKTTSSYDTGGYTGNWK